MSERIRNGRIDYLRIRAATISSKLHRGSLLEVLDAVQAEREYICELEAENTILHVKLDNAEISAIQMDECLVKAETKLKAVEGLPEKWLEHYPNTEAEHCVTDLESALRGEE